MGGGVCLLDTMIFIVCLVHNLAGASHIMLAGDLGSDVEEVWKGDRSLS